VLSEMIFLDGLRAFEQGSATGDGSQRRRAAEWQGSEEQGARTSFEPPPP
jgi:hypothetical protein